MPGALDAFGYTLEDFYQAIRIINESRYAIAAVYGLQIYEWFLSIDQEYHLIFQAKWTSIKVAYLLCRYYPLCLWPLVMWAYLLDHNVELCLHVARLVHGMLAPFQFFSQAVMLMRAYAFSGRKKRILYLLSFCYVTVIAVDFWAFCANIEISPPLFYTILGGTGCFPNYGEGPIGLRIGYSMLAALLMDLISLLVVIGHCYKTRSRDVSLGRYFVNQGLGAFFFVLIVNIVSAIVYFRPPSFRDGVGLPLILVISNLVACRVILDLRQKVYPTDTEISQRNSSIIRNALAPRSYDVWDCV